MKITALALTAALTASGALYAQAPNPPTAPKSPPAPPAATMPADHYGKLDSNHDGKLSRDELQDLKLSSSDFSSLDANGDGTLSKEEFAMHKMK